MAFKKMELNPEQASEEESSQGGVSDTDDVGSVSVPVDDEGFETLAAEIKEVLAELAQVFTFSLVLIMIGLLFTRAWTRDGRRSLIWEVRLGGLERVVSVHNRVMPEGEKH